MNKLLITRFLISSSLFANNVIPAEEKKTFTDDDIKLCASCHGNEFEKRALGKSKIVKDMSEEEISKSLKGYKDGSYGGVMKTIMKTHVIKYSDTELEEMAKFLKKPITSTENKQ